MEDRDSEILRLKKELEWYRNTFEKRRLVGIVKDRVVKKLDQIKYFNRNTNEHTLNAGESDNDSIEKFSRLPQNQININKSEDEIAVSSISVQKPQRFMKDIFPHFYTKSDEKWDIEIDLEVDIILPIYNGLGFVKILIPQIFEHSDLPFKLFIVNDCSPDKNVLPYLKSIAAEHANVILINNEINIGFTHSVNKALRKTTNHVVLLNSDTEVPKSWLSRLIYPVTVNPKVASCTPFSNCATICSFPNIGDNDLFGNLSSHEIDKIFQRGKSYYFEIPTGVGFCMLLNRKAIELVGILDEGRFEKGYGEEVDWCQRAIKAGFSNVLVQNLFVYHKHGASFKAEDKNNLVNTHQAVIDSLYPDFHFRVMNSIENSFHNKIRDFFSLLTSNSISRRTILYYDHELGGGANLYINNCVAQLKDDNLIMVLRYNHPLSNPLKSFSLKFYFKEYSADFLLNSTEDIQRFFNYIKIDEIILSEIVSYPNPKKELERLLFCKKQFNVKLTFLLHDYYAVCPNFNLMYKNKYFCNIPEMSGCEECVKMVDYNPVLFPTDYNDLKDWRKEWNNFLKGIDLIICFAESAKNILLKAYPELTVNKIEVIPHTVEEIKNINDISAYQEDKKKFPVDKTNRPLTIGILGKIHSEFKGGKLLNSIANSLEEKNIKDIQMVVIGELDPSFEHSKINVLGVYSRKDISKIISKNKIDAFFIPSIWPETFSYTTAEAILTGLPVICYNIGGQADQVKKYHKGFIISEISIESTIETMNKVKSKIL